MKKLTLVVLLLVGGFAIMRAVGTYQSESFLKGTAVVVAQPASATALTLTSGSTTPLWTNKLGQTITAGTNSLGATYGAWDQAVRVFANGNGDAPVTSVSLILPAGSTNTITLTLQRSPDGVNYDAGTTWSFTTPADVALVGRVVVTNVPTWLVTGAQTIRVSTIVFATNSFGYTNGITHLGFNGFVP